MAHKLSMEEMTNGKKVSSRNTGRWKLWDETMGYLTFEEVRDLSIEWLRKYSSNVTEIKISEINSLHVHYFSIAVTKSSIN
jgi:hypothetical protein